MRYRLFFFILTIIVPTASFACTIFCAKDSHGQMWAANNEDFYWFYFSTQVKIVPKTDTTLGFLYLNYENHDFPQGGVNEAGLFYDANMVEASPLKNADHKSPFPGNGPALMSYILGTCKTVPEVLSLFQKYRVDELTSGQIHLADKTGNMGLITADSAWLTPGNFQVSTNYNLSHRDDDYKNCWRYPIAYSLLSSNSPDLELMTRACDSTSQRKGATTIYSNIHNLSTGEIWWYYGWDYENPYKTSVDELLALGDTVIMMRDLFATQPLVKAYEALTAKGFTEALKILNTIHDPAIREEKISLLTMAALFDFGQFVADGNIAIKNNDHLLQEIIEASNDRDLLSLLLKQNLSKKNRELAETKLGNPEKSGWLSYLMIAVGVVVIVGAVWGLTKNR